MYLLVQSKKPTSPMVSDNTSSDKEEITPKVGIDFSNF